MVRRYDGGVHYEVMYLKQIQRNGNVYMFRVLTKFSVKPIVSAILTYVTGRQWHDEAFLLQKVFVFTLACPIISQEVSAIFTDLIVSQLRDTPYIYRRI